MTHLPRRFYLVIVLIKQYILQSFSIQDKMFSLQDVKQLAYWREDREGLRPRLIIGMR